MHVIFFVDNIFSVNSVLTPAVIFDSRKFKGHFLSSDSATVGAGGFHRTK